VRLRHIDLSGRFPFRFAHGGASNPWESRRILARILGFESVSYTGWLHDPILPGRNARRDYFDALIEISQSKTTLFKQSM
jgi:hypothetical protein